MKACSFSVFLIPDLKTITYRELFNVVKKNSEEISAQNSLIPPNHDEMVWGSNATLVT